MTAYKGHGKEALCGVLGIVGLFALGACSTVSSVGQSSVSALGSVFAFGNDSAPPPLPDSPDAVECPPVIVSDDGAAARTFAGRSGDANALRSQIVIADVARECRGQPDGSIVVKVGVEARGMLGPAGHPGRFETPLHIRLKRGDKVLASRAARVSVAVPSGEAQGSAVVVQDGLVVPPNTGEFEIEVGLGAPPRAPRAAARSRQAAPSEE